MNQSGTIPSMAFSLQTWLVEFVANLMIYSNSRIFDAKFKYVEKALC
jgi:hypothetical protein